MKRTHVLSIVLTLGLALALTNSAGLAQGTEPQGDTQPLALLGTGFTYQGQLKSGGTPYSGACDLRFGLWDALSGGAQIGAAQTRANVSLAEGYFTVQLDFGAGAFPGDARWLAIEVRCPAGAGSYTLLSPRQPLTATPYALYATAAPWAGLVQVPAGFADGVDNDTTYNAGTGLSLSGGQFSLAATYRLPQGCASGQIAEWTGSAWICGNDDSGGGAANAWLLTGNAGTTPGTQFVGTTDNRALELKVNGQRALRLEPQAKGPNLIGGSALNTVTAGVHGATIGGGGGESGFFNWVTDNYGTVGGGLNNFAGDTAGTTSDRVYATVGGGLGNWAAGEFATAGGGRVNYAGGQYATVGGGSDSQATGPYSTVAGGGWNLATDDFATVGGGFNNRAGDNAGSTADRAYATVGGGRDNVASGTSSVVSGGDTNTASGDRATVPGGVGNVASGHHSFAAGRRAKALHDGAFVWADAHDADFVSDAANEFLVRAYNGVKIVRGASTYSASQAALQVDQAAAAEAGWFYTLHADNAYAVLKVAKLPAAPGNFIDGVDRTAEGVETRRFHIDRNGTYIAGSDFAEALPATGDPADYEPGDVLVISLERPGGVEKCRQPYDGRVLGVYSTRPGFLGADKAGVTEVAAGDLPVAVLGIVPVKVSAENGSIQPGDLLTTSSMPGHAMRCEGLEQCFGRTLGKALEGLAAGQGTGVIRVLVTLQ
ncbi:MAG: hypothetical protein JXM73_05160 [Anaerolineae bacterium]|nr:hypothetical protein [Anaerolineae bacterium]